MPRRLLIRLAAPLFAGLLLAACEGSDATSTTSPSIRAMMGTTAGSVAYGIDLAPPAPVAAPDGWSVQPGNARFEPLENGDPGLFVVGEFNTQAGPVLELWLTDDTGATVARWSGGSARRYSGAVCWQHRLESEDGTESLPIDPARTYEMTVVFRDIAANTIVSAATIPVRNTPPSLHGADPGAGSEVFRDLLGCPR